jgi:hypothetical protein
MSVFWRKRLTEAGIQSVDLIYVEGLSAVLRTTGSFCAT